MNLVESLVWTFSWLVAETSLVYSLRGLSAPNRELQCRWNPMLFQKEWHRRKVKKTIFPKLRVRIKDNNNSPHGKFHRFSYPFSSKFPDLNFATYDIYIYPCYQTRAWHTQWAWVTFVFTLATGADPGFFNGFGWYSRPPNYTLIYYKLSDVWPQIWRFWWFWLLWRGVASHPTHPSGSAPRQIDIAAMNRSSKWRMFSSKWPIVSSKWP